MEASLDSEVLGSACDLCAGASLVEYSALPNVIRSISSRYDIDEHFRATGDSFLFDSDSETLSGLAELLDKMFSGSICYLFDMQFIGSACACRVQGEELVQHFRSIWRHGVDDILMINDEYGALILHFDELLYCQVEILTVD